MSPKSWLLSRKLRISNCSPESQKQENVPPPGCYRINFTCLSEYPFSDTGRNLTEYPAGCHASEHIWKIESGHTRKIHPAGCDRINILLWTTPQNRQPATGQIHKFSQYQPGRDTFSFFCDSGEQLEILNFLPGIQDLGLTVCRCQKPGSPKRCLPVPAHKACHNARASGTGPSAATALKQKI